MTTTDGAGRRRRNILRALVGLVVVAGAVVLLAGAMNGTLTYYRTPSELGRDPAAARQHIRLGGLVVAGSVEHHGPVVRFTLTDGAADVEVVTRDTPPQTFHGGRGAVVDGHLTSGGVFEATQVLVRHSDEYRPPKRRAAEAAGG